MDNTAKQSEAEQHEYIGQNVEDIPKPAAILEASKIQRHCSSMLEVAQRLDVGFRAHIKTHKTIEVTKLQLGDSNEEAKIVVSTVAEIEHVLPLLEEYQRNGRRVNVLYGIPLPPSRVPRLALLAKKLGPGSIAFMLDHPSQLAAVRRFHELAGFPAGVFIKVDTGYHRAGLAPSFLNKGGLVEEISRLESQGQVYLIGLYSHSSLSYQGATPQQAMGSLSGEIAGCLEALDELRKLYTHDRVLAISVGASPQAIAMQNLEDEASWSGLTSELQQQLRIFSSGEVEGAKVALEIHAGVYSIMDIQQVATRSKESMKSYEDEIALSVIAEVVSVYNDGERKQPEALIAVGTLGLGREPCQGYPGWGVVSSRSTPELAECERRLIVARISQEHAVLTWDVPSGEDATTLPPIPLQVGQSVFVYPNHACITGAMYKSYLVVDSLEKGSECQVRAVWDRTGGW